MMASLGSSARQLYGALRTPREFDFGGKWDLITELTQDWGKRVLEGTNKTMWAPEPRRKGSDPTGD